MRNLRPEAVAVNFLDASASTLPAPLGSSGKATSLDSSALMATLVSKRNRPRTTTLRDNRTCILHSFVGALMAGRTVETKPDSKVPLACGQRASRSGTRNSLKETVSDNLLRWPHAAPL